MRFKTVVDQMGETVTFPFPPRRIVSLVPSQTEFLSSLGLDHEVIGITKFCIHPESWHRSKTKVGGTKNFSIDVIDSLAPDLIIGNKEENYLEGISKLKEKYPVWMSDIFTVDQACDMMVALGELTDRLVKAKAIVQAVQETFGELPRYDSRTVLYLIWKNPFMAVGKQTFIDDILCRLGLKNVCSSMRYPEISFGLMQKWKPEIVMLSSEPYPFKESNITEIRELLPESKIILVDGEMFSWYGSRLKLAPEYFKLLRF